MNNNQQLSLLDSNFGNTFILTETKEERIMQQKKKMEARENKEHNINISQANNTKDHCLHIVENSIAHDR